MRRKQKLVVILAAALLCWAAGLYAGKQVEFICKNRACGLKEEVTFGGGFRFCQITGWCVACKKFVYLTWDRPAEGKGGKTAPSKAQQEPKPIGKVWVASAGKMAEIYACPDCRGPFLPIASPEEMTACPKCGKPGFGHDPKKVIMFD